MATRLQAVMSGTITRVVHTSIYVTNILYGIVYTVYTSISEKSFFGVYG